MSSDYAEIISDKIEVECLKVGGFWAISRKFCKVIKKRNFDITTVIDKQIRKNKRVTQREYLIKNWKNLENQFSTFNIWV